MIGLAQSVEQCLTFFLVQTTLGLIGATLGMIIGLVCRDVSEAQQVVMPTLVPLILFSGYVIPWGQIRDVYKPLYHLSFFQYALSMLQANEFKNAVFDDCSPIVHRLGACFNTGEEYLEAMHMEKSIWKFYYPILCCYIPVLLFGAYRAARRVVSKKS